MSILGALSGCKNSRVNTPFLGCKRLRFNKIHGIIPLFRNRSVGYSYVARN